MGILFDYTQAEETEPEMSRLGQLFFFFLSFFFLSFFFLFFFWRLKQTAVFVSPHARTSQNWLFMKVGVCVHDLCL